MPSGPSITLIFPDVGEAPEGKPKFCLRCGSPYLSRHGLVRRPVADTNHSEVSVQRYRCSHCGFTFRAYPSGVGRTKGSTSVEALAILLVAVGLSCIKADMVIQAAGADISQATVWRVIQKAGFQIDEFHPRKRMHQRLLNDLEEPGDDLNCVWYRFLENQDHEMVGIEVWTHVEMVFSSQVKKFFQDRGATLTLEEVSAS